MAQAGGCSGHTVRVRVALSGGWLAANAARRANGFAARYEQRYVIQPEVGDGACIIRAAEIDPDGLTGECQNVEGYMAIIRIARPSILVDVRQVRYRCQ